MPLFVTPILPSRRAPSATATLGSRDDSARESGAYRARVARLRTPAPDSLVVRVRRELREASASTMRSE